MFPPCAYAGRLAETIKTISKNVGSVACRASLTKRAFIDFFPWLLIGRGCRGFPGKSTVDSVRKQFIPSPPFQRDTIPLVRCQVSFSRGLFRAGGSSH